MTVLCVPYSLDSGLMRTRLGPRPSWVGIDSGGGGCGPKQLANGMRVFVRSEGVHGGAGSSLLSSLELTDTTIYEPEIRALLGRAPRFC